MIPNIPQQQHQMKLPSFQDAYPPQELLTIAYFPSQHVLQTQTQTTHFQNVYNPSYPPQTNIPNPQEHPSPTNIPSSSSQSFILPQSFTLNQLTPP